MPPPSGGYWCWDETSCQERYQTLKFDMSSSGWGKLFAQDGIFSTVQANNPFASANMVFIKYCSSDSWFGDAPASASTWGFAFRGSRIVTAVIAALEQYNGLGASGGTERLLFAGCSAGGRGVLTNLDAVAAAVPSNVRVQGLLDAAAWVDVQPIIPNMLTLQQMTQDLYSFTAPPIPAQCAARYQGADAWMCLWPSYRLPFIQTDYFLNAAQFDAFQIMYDTNNLDSTYCCETPPEQQWVEQFQVQTLALFKQLPGNVATYSSSCLVHCLSSNADFWTFTVNGQSLAQEVGSWFFNNQPVSLVSSCTGWDCTLQCSGGPWEPTNQQCQTTTNQCANDYMITQSGSGPQSNQQSQASIAAGNAAWEAQQKAQQGQGKNFENSDWSATNVLSAVSASSSLSSATVSAAGVSGAAAGPFAAPAGNAAGVVGVAEPALTQAQQQQLQTLAAQQAQQ